MTSSSAADVLWTPDEQENQALEFTAYCDWLRASGVATEEDTADYRSVWEWSIDDVERFWRTFAEYAGVGLEPSGSGRAVPLGMPGGDWFGASNVNYAEIALGHDIDGPAIVALAEDGTRVTLTWSELRAQVGAVAGFLRRQGIAKGDRVVAVLPNRVEAIVGLLAAASVGAVWSIVAPEFGAEAIVARLGQLEPKVLICTRSYDFRGRTIDRSDTLEAVLEQLPTLVHVIWVGSAVSPPPGPAVHSWAEVIAVSETWQVSPTRFGDPLWVVFSSGTTGIPKGIVHGHGGVVLEHLKTLTLHADLRPGDSFLAVASTSWVVWNMLASGLLRGATIVLLDGDAAYPDLDRVWAVASQERARVLCLGAGFVHASMRAGCRPGTDHDLSSLRMIQVTGSPLTPDGYRWVYDAVGDVWLASASGGTDIAGIFLGGAPTEPVRAGRLQPAALGVAAQAWNNAGDPVVGEVGELVITKPMPSMPLYFWNDPDGSRYRSSYFSSYPGVWCHGDMVEFDADGSSVILGRSDSTLNRNGIRLGPADIYQVVESLDDVVESLIVGVERGDSYYMPLFVHLADGVEAATAIDTIKRAIRERLSPRFIPDEIIPVSAIPHTRTGKKLEVPVKRLVQGMSIDAVVDRGSIDDIGALAEIRDRVARAGVAGPGGSR